MTIGITGPRRRVPWRGAVWALIIAAIFVAIGLILLGLTGDFLVDWLWFSSIGYVQVFWTTIVTKAKVFFDGDYEIYSIRPDGTDLKRLTYSPGNDAHLAWSRDGKWIAFASARTGYTDEMVLHPYNGQATGEIFVMRADGSDVGRLTENQFEDATLGWRPSKARSLKLRN
jgi:hypothetical protein